MNAILVAGRCADSVAHVTSTVQRGANIEARAHVLSNGASDPLLNANDPAALVLVLHDDSTGELEALGARAPESRIPLIVVGNDTNPDMMRLAMQAGARDFLSRTADEGLLLNSLARLTAEQRAAVNGSCKQIAVINAAGGDGASTIAVNLAHASANAAGATTLLMDLDLQFGPLAQYLDLIPQRDFREALARSDELDAIALDGYLARHRSGLRFVSSAATSTEVSAESIEMGMPKMLSLIRKTHDRLIVDVPNHLDALSRQVLAHSDTILVVLQQKLSSIRNATRLVEIMRHELGVPDTNIELVVNRYQKNAPLELADIRSTVKDGQIMTIPNQFRIVSESIDFGVPCIEHAPTSGVAKAVDALEQHLGGTRAQKRSAG